MHVARNALRSPARESLPVNASTWMPTRTNGVYCRRDTCGNLPADLRHRLAASTEPRTK